MKKYIVPALAAGLALAGWGCASQDPQSAAAGRKAFSSMQRAVAAAARPQAQSLALVKVEKEKTESPSRSGLGALIASMSRAGAATTGILLTPQGHVLAPGIIKPEDDSRITVLVGDNEYVARAVKTGEALNMTVLKLETDDTFTPADLARTADLAAGEWAVALKPTDEELDYQVLTTPIVCQGEKEGRYRRFLFESPLGSYAGALVVNLSGAVVGVADREGVLSINDLREDLQRLTDDAAGKGGREERKKGWFGAMVSPVNKDFARARSIPASSLAVLHAVKNSPAAAAGLREGDLIVALNGRPLRFTGSRAQDYFQKSLQPRAGERFALTVLREGRPVELSGVFTKAPEPETLRAEDIGVSIADITDTEVHTRNLAVDAGVLVTDVQRGSPAANSGTLRQTLIEEGDVIVELAGQPTPTVAAFGKALESIRRDGARIVLVKYHRGLLTGYAGLNLTLGEKSQGNKQ